MSPRDRDTRRRRTAIVGAGLTAIAIAVSIGILATSGGDGANVPGSLHRERLQYIAARDIGTLPARSNWCSISRAAEHCWILQQSSGDATDYGEGSWHLTPTGTRPGVLTSLPTASASGWVDYTTELATWGDGGATSGLIEVGAVPSATNVLSVTFLGKPTEDGALGSFVSQRDASPPQKGWYIYMPSGGNVSGSIDYGAGVVNVSGTTDLRDAWHCITVVLDARSANAGRVYVDRADDTVGAGDLSVAAAGFTSTSPFRIHGVLDSASFASRHGVARVRFDEGHATTLEEHQAHCGAMWQVPAGGENDDKPLLADVSWTQTGGARCYPTSDASAVCVPGGLVPYVMDATRLDWPVDPDATNRIPYNTEINCTNWDCFGTGDATAYQVAPDGSATASWLSVGTWASNRVSVSGSGYSNSVTLYPRLWVSCTSGILRMQHLSSPTYGQWSINCTTVGGAWTLIRPGHAALTENTAWASTSGGAAGIAFVTPSGTIDATIWAPTLTEEPGTGQMVIPTRASAVSTGDPVWAVSNELRSTGAQLLDDGDCEAVGVAGWSSTGDASLIKSTASPHGGLRAIRLTYVSTASPYFYRPGTVSNGTIYRQIGWARGDGASTYPVLRRGSGATLWTGTTSTNWQQFDVIADPISNALFRRYTIGTGWTEWDDMTIYEQEAGGPYYYAGDTVLQSLTEYSGTCWEPLTEAGNLLLSGSTTCAGTWYSLTVTP